MERVNRLSEKTDQLREEVEHQRLEINALQRAIDSAESVLRMWKDYARTLFLALRDTGRSAPPPPAEIADDWREMI